MKDRNAAWIWVGLAVALLVLAVFGCSGGAGVAGPEVAPMAAVLDMGNYRVTVTGSLNGGLQTSATTVWLVSGSDSVNASGYTDESRIGHPMNGNGTRVAGTSSMELRIALYSVLADYGDGPVGSDGDAFNVLLRITPAGSGQWVCSVEQANFQNTTGRATGCSFVKITAPLYW